MKKSMTQTRRNESGRCNGLIEQILKEAGATSKETRLSADELILAGSFADKRALSAAVRAERLNGALILSTKCCGGGYWVSDDPDEIEAFIQTYSAEGRSLFAMQKAARQRQKDFETS